MAADKLSEEQAAAIRAEFERDFGGQENAHRALTGNYPSTVETALPSRRGRSSSSREILGWRRASREVIEYHGALLKIEPGFWLRRWSRWPFYFQNWSPRFRLRVTPTPGLELEWWQVAGRQLTLEVTFEDGRRTVIPLTVPALSEGEAATVEFGPVVTHTPGQTEIQLSRFGFIADPDTLYSYPVYPEERVWTAILAPVGLLLSGIAGAWLQAQLGFLP